MSSDDRAGADSTTSSLLERARLRDSNAWHRLVVLYSPLVYQWTRNSGLESNDAADVAQDVFHAIAANLDSFRLDGPNSSFRGWVWTITRNKLNDFYRARSCQPRAEGGSNPSWIEQVAESPPDDADPQNSAVDRLFNRALELVRSEFESRTWQAFWRVTVDGDRPAAVAIDLKMSVAAVYMAKSRVFRRVRTELSGLFD